MFSPPTFHCSWNATRKYRDNGEHSRTPNDRRPRKIKHTVILAFYHYKAKQYFRGRAQNYCILYRNLIKIQLFHAKPWICWNSNWVMKTIYVRFVHCCFRWESIKSIVCHNIFWLESNCWPIISTNNVNLQKEIALFLETAVNACA